MTVAVPANAKPVAAFTSTVDDLKVTLRRVGLDRSATARCASYAWDFGDGDTGTGRPTATPTRRRGTYRVTLTVTDDNGRATRHQDVTVTWPPAAGEQRCRDRRLRPHRARWGTADTGGAWTDAGFDLLLDQRQQGLLVKLTKAGVGPIASLNAVSVQNSVTRVEFAADKAGTGGGNYLTLSSRRIGTSEARLTARLMPDATVRLGAAESSDGTQVLPQGGRGAQYDVRAGRRVGHVVQRDG